MSHCHTTLESCSNPFCSAERDAFACQQLISDQGSRRQLRQQYRRQFLNVCQFNAYPDDHLSTYPGGSTPEESSSEFVVAEKPCALKSRSASAIVVPSHKEANGSATYSLLASKTIRKRTTMLLLLAMVLSVSELKAVGWSKFTGTGLIILRVGWNILSAVVGCILIGMLLFSNC